MNKVEWIPVSERLPEEGQKVLITLVDHRRRKVNTKYNGEKLYSIRIDKIIKSWGNPPFWAKGNTPSIVAWTPLPEPYKEGEQ